MNFFLFAAGIGKRLRPLTLHTPKPLIRIHNQPLIGRLLEHILPYADTVFINVAWLGEQIEQFITGHHPHDNIVILKEKTPLETGGALCHAFDHAESQHAGLDKHPFVVINSDIYTDYDFSRLIHTATTTFVNTSISEPDILGHLVLIDRSSFKHASGDFDLIGNRVHGNAHSRGKLTYSGIGLIHPHLLKRYQSSPSLPTEKPCFSLAKALYDASEKGRLCGEIFTGIWYDVGTPKSLEVLQSMKMNAPIATGNSSFQVKKPLKIPRPQGTGS